MQIERPDSPAAVSLDLTIPGETRYRETARSLAVQMARHAGYIEPAAREIGVALDSVVRGIIDEVYGRGEAAPGGIVLSLHAGDIFSVAIRYRLRSAGMAPVEKRLDAQPEGRTLLAYLRGAMDRLEFGCDDAGCYCRLTCRPPEPA
jgi:hypothetical protein